MKKLLIGAAIALLPLTAFSATVLGFQAGGGSWQQTPSGAVTSSIGTDTLSSTQENVGYTYFILEHPIPIIPNIKYGQSKVTTTGTTTITLLNIDQTDTTLYYELLDNVVSLDIGITAKNIDGLITTAGSSTTLAGTVPLLYVAAEIELPAGFSLAGEISTISSGSNEITDVTVKVAYTTDFMLGVEAGLRTQNFNIDIDNEKIDAKFSGVFAGVYFKF